MITINGTKNTLTCLRPTAYARQRIHGLVPGAAEHFNLVKSARERSKIATFVMHESSCRRSCHTKARAVKS